MRLVDKPVKRPMHCAAVPHRSAVSEGERWVDTGSELPGFDNHVYLSETAIREAGRLLGFAPPTELAALTEAAADHLVTIEELQARIAYLEEILYSADVVRAYVESLSTPEDDVVDTPEGDAVMKAKAKK